MSRGGHRRHGRPEDEQGWYPEEQTEAPPEYERGGGPYRTGAGGYGYPPDPYGQPGAREAAEHVRPPGGPYPDPGQAADPYRGPQGRPAQQPWAGAPGSGPDGYGANSLPVRQPGAYDAGPGRRPDAYDPAARPDVPGGTSRWSAPQAPRALPPGPSGAPGNAGQALEQPGWRAQPQQAQPQRALPGGADSRQSAPQARHGQRFPGDAPRPPMGFPGDAPRPPMGFPGDARRPPMAPGSYPQVPRQDQPRSHPSGPFMQAPLADPVRHRQVSGPYPRLPEDDPLQAGNAPPPGRPRHAGPGQLPSPRREAEERGALEGRPPRPAPRPPGGDWSPGERDRYADEERARYYPQTRPGAREDRYPDTRRPAGERDRYTDGGWHAGDEDPQAWDEEGYDEDFVPGMDDAPRGGGGRTGRTGRGGRNGGQRRRARWIAPLVAVLVIVLPLSIAGLYGYNFVTSRYYPADFSGSGTGQVVVRIQSGDTATVVGQRLMSAGVIASVRAFVLAAEHSTSQTALEPGFYRLHKQMKATLAFTLLLAPAARDQIKITVPEGRRLSQVLATLGALSGMQLSDYQQALRNPASLGLPSFARDNPEGYLFPATYEIQPDMTAADVLKGMVSRFNQEAASVSLVQAAAGLRLTPAQVIIVASLVQAEGGAVSDYPKIARVIYNRLAQGMQLQLDSTVMYALHTYGILASTQQLQVSSPYNTYLHSGLPPGPIDNPGDAAIRAALRPANGNWVYFVTVNPKTGQTEFTADPNQFQQFQAELRANLGQG